MNKLRFAYRMYDMNRDGSISKEEILAVLVMMVGPHVDRAQLESIAERAMLEVILSLIVQLNDLWQFDLEFQVDDDADNTMSFEEYVHMMERICVEDKMSINFLD